MANFHWPASGANTTGETSSDESFRGQSDWAMASAATNPSWYTWDRRQDTWVLQFQPAPERYWPPSILCDQPLGLPDAAPSVATVVLTGPGAVWMYAHAAAVCRRAGFAVKVESIPRLDATDGLEDCHAQWSTADTDLSKAVISVQLRANPPVSQGGLERLLASPLSNLNAFRPSELVIFGRASVDVYTRIAGEAVGASTCVVYCWSARDGLVRVWDRQDPKNVGGPWPVPNWYRQLMRQPCQPAVIGVVGDPNHGKSVMSRCLDYYGTKALRETWCLDCDAQSPTPPWYVSLVAHDPQEANRLRSGLKRRWTSHMERAVANQLRVARRLFDVLIADLPGGNHKISPPMRIPESRVEVFRQVDAFIVMDDREGVSGRGWCEALQQVGLGDRVCAFICSENPSGDFSLVWHEQGGGILRGTATGLDRAVLPRLPELYLQTRDRFQVLWDHVLARARSFSSVHTQ
ncbi:MAG: hypothetical protein KatS3mg110_0523 [Pirellulaceae bacterium]|nr:MAG: hypothetical protein KatS3mg110_0523 [Pirellulaceae bacterium]